MNNTPIDKLLNMLQSGMELNNTDIENAVKQWNNITEQDPVCWARIDKSKNVFCLIRSTHYSNYQDKQLLTPLYSIN